MSWQCSWMPGWCKCDIPAACGRPASFVYVPPQHKSWRWWVPMFLCCPNSSNYPNSRLPRWHQWRCRIPSWWGQGRGRGDLNLASSLGENASRCPGYHRDRWVSEVHNSSWWRWRVDRSKDCLVSVHAHQSKNRCGWNDKSGRWILYLQDWI